MPFGRLEQRARPAPMSDINMTPLIDVMLVLLVIFIVAAPLMAPSLRLDLPRAEGAQPSDAKDALRVAVDSEGRVFLGDEALAPADVDVSAEERRRRHDHPEERRAPHGLVWLRFLARHGTTSHRSIIE